MRWLLCALIILVAANAFTSTVIQWRKTDIEVRGTAHNISDDALSSSLKRTDVHDFVCDPPPRLAQHRRHMASIANLVRERLCGENGARLRVCTSPLPFELRRREPIFLHYPKTGGEAIEAALGLTKNHLMAFDRLRFSMQASEDTRQRATTLHFSTVRNPLSRMLSWFRFCILGYDGRMPNPQRICALARASWLAELPLATLPRIALRSAYSAFLERLTTTNLTTYPFRLSGMYGSQYVHAVISTYTRFLSQPVFMSDAPLDVDFILNFDALDRDFDSLLCLLDMSSNISLPRINVSGRGPVGMPNRVARTDDHFARNHNASFMANFPSFCDAYTEHSRRIVLDWFREDFELFNFDTCATL